MTQAQLDLGYTTIKAPVAGIIGRLDVDEGNLVGRGEPTLLATMSTIDPIKVSATVSEVDYLRFARRAAGRARTDQALALELVLADGTVHPHKGRVTTLDRTVDPKTGTIVVEAQFPNPEKLLRPGQFGGCGRSSRSVRTPSWCRNSPSRRFRGRSLSWWSVRVTRSPCGA